MAMGYANADVGNIPARLYSVFVTHLEYMQSEASRNMSFHMDNMDNLQKESNNTLTFLYVVISASFSGALKLFLDGKLTILAVSLSILCCYLALLAVCLVFSCMWAKDAEAPANEPRNLKIKEPYTSVEIQQFELENLQKRIEFNRNRNAKTGQRLNLIRVFICLSPVVFIVAWAILSLG